jgi:1-pyrroline-5-carboxylate dehydrogenase
MFQNEITFVRMQKAGKEAEFHRLYEEALKEAEKYLHKEYPNLIGREIIEKEKIKDISPIDGKEIATFQMASSENINMALEMLHSSWKKWYEMGYVERARIMLKAADEISRQKYLISALLAYENGKNRTEAMADVDEGIDFLRYYAINMIENQGFHRLSGKGYDNEESFSVMKPYGVFAVIPPFNFYAITVGMTAGPLTVGNAVLLKSSSDIPISTYLTVKILHESGVPKEALAVITGSGRVVGKYVVESDLVSGIVFTGSREVGMDIYHRAQEKRPKPVITEMGGKDAVIVTAKADLDKAVEGIFRGAFGFSGQKCSATSLAYVHEAVYDKFVEKLKERARNVLPEDPRKKEAFVNPVVNREAYDKFKALEPKFREYGDVIVGGKALDKPGYYVEATILKDVKRDSYLAKNELFLPVLGIIKVKDLKDAVDEINKSDYGLTGGIFTEDYDEIQYYFNNVDVGVIYANRARGASTGAMVGSQPFVGWKLSGSSGKGTGSYYYLPQFLREQSQTIAH